MFPSKADPPTLSHQKRRLPSTQYLLLVVLPSTPHVHPTSTSRSSANPTAPPSQHIGTPTTSRHLHLHHLGPWTHKAAPNCPLCCHLCLSRVSMPHGNWFKSSLVSSLLKTPQWLLFANRINAQVLPRVLCDLVPLTIQL